MDEDFRSPAGRARNARIALFIFCAASLVYAVSVALTLMTIEALKADTTPMLSADTVDDITGIVALGLMVVNLTTMVLCALWIYRSNKNAHTLSYGISVSPGWAIGWFAVPIASLWRPFTGIRETWQVSADPGDPESVPVPGIMRLWWGTWLIGLLLGNISFRLSMTGGAAQLQTSLWIDLLSLPFDLTAALTFAYIIKRISEMQDNPVDASVFD